MKVLSLFDGISCGRVALERAGMPIEKYYASEIDKYAIQVAQKNYPDTIQIGDVTKVDFTQYRGKIDLVIGGSPCFPAGTLIFTDNGFVPIESIKVGDKVLTHTGKFQRVLRTGAKPTNELRLLSGGGIARLFCTPNHPFYVRDVAWKGRVPKRVFGKPYWLEAENISKKQMISTLTPGFELTPYKNETFWKFIGRYVGDGWYRKSKRKGRKNSFIYQVIICCSHNEFYELKELFDAMGCNYNFSKERTVYKFRICQKWLVDFMEQNVGHGALNKQVPTLLFKQPESYKRAFLQGLIDSDGCNDGKRIRVATISKKLAYGIKMLVADIDGVLAQVLFYKRQKEKNIENRIVFQHDGYEVCWYPKAKKTKKYVYDANKYWSYLRHNDFVQETTVVYNLEVEEDNSYTADTIIVHNCQGFSFAGKQLNFNDPRSKLFFEFVRAIREIRPKYFLLENVKMKQEFQDIISEHLGVQPIEINSALVSAQNRRRLYWTNIPGVCQPADRNILLQDIIQQDENKNLVDKDKSLCITCSYSYGLSPMHSIQKHTRQCVFTLTDNDSPGRKYVVRDKIIRPFDENTTKSKTTACKINLPDGCYYVRKLTPIECERLQNLPDNYTDCISDSRRYTALGNAWTVDVITHIFKGLKQ